MSGTDPASQFYSEPYNSFLFNVLHPYFITNFPPPTTNLPPPPDQDTCTHKIYVPLLDKVTTPGATTLPAADVCSVDDDDSVNQTSPEEKEVNSRND